MSIKEDPMLCNVTSILSLMSDKSETHILSEFEKGQAGRNLATLILSYAKVCSFIFFICLFVYFFHI